MRMKKKTKWSIIAGDYVRSDGRAKVLRNLYPGLNTMLDYHYLDNSGDWRVEDQFLSAYLHGSKKSEREVLGQIVDYEPDVIRRIADRLQNTV